jgi:predicted RNA polymerase sigma factor
MCPERGLDELRTIADAGRLARYPFYEAALAEFELHRGHSEVAREHFANALKIARNQTERQFFEKKIRDCEEH